MIYDYFHISKPAELKLRRNRSMNKRISKQTLKIHAEARVKKYNEIMSIEKFVRGIIYDCVEAVCDMISSEGKHNIPLRENKEEEKKVILPQRVLKRRRGWRTWYERCYAIYLLLHPMIFNNNAAEASLTLGIPRGTLLSWVSCSVKRNLVSK